MCVQQHLPLSCNSAATALPIKVLVIDGNWQGLIILFIAARARKTAVDHAGWQARKSGGGRSCAGRCACILWL
jgi:hypothetical protein